MFSVAHKIMVESETCMFKKNLSISKICVIPATVCWRVQCPEDSHPPRCRVDKVKDFVLAGDLKSQTGRTNMKEASSTCHFYLKKKKKRGRVLQ